MRTPWSALPTALVLGTLAISGVAVAEPSGESPPEAITSRESPRSFAPLPSATKGTASPGAPVAGDATIQRSSPSVQESAPATEPGRRSFQRDFPRSER